MGTIKVERALLSVFDKTGIVEFARELKKRGVEILSTGGTYKKLVEEGIECVAIDEYTGQKEIFGGRVKTLHPLIHGGILSKRDKEAEEIGMRGIDLVVVNLYPFESLVEKGEKELAKLIEMIDIGGPTMLRSAAKNYKFCCPLPKACYYNTILKELESGGIKEETRLMMALEVFKTTSYYDTVITSTLSKFEMSEEEGEKIVEKTTIPLKKEIDMRYGENPHQMAAYYSFPEYPAENSALFFTEGKLHGKTLSYNNISDTSAALRIMADLPEESCVALKHANPCGAAVRPSVYESFKAAYEGDKVSIFGGIVGCKGILTAEAARLMSGIFLEIIIAESFEKEAFEILSKKKNIRLMEYKKWKDILFSGKKIEYKSVAGGFLAQETDSLNPFDEEYKVVTAAKPGENQLKDLQFAQVMVKHVKSNAIVVVKDSMLLGVGAGQMNRVNAAKIALDWAGEKSDGAVLGSDAFFPMDDTVRLAAERGIKAIAQPGGSIKDEDSIKACDELGLAMAFTGNRHFYH